MTDRTPPDDTVPEAAPATRDAAPAFSRRAVVAGGVGGLGAGLAVGLGAGVGAGVGADRLLGGSGASEDSSGAPGPAGAQGVDFHGVHQPGVTTLPAQAHARFVALDLRPGAGVAELRRLMRLLTDDIERLMSGRPPLAAEDPQLPRLPSRLTVTVGLGPGWFRAAGREQDCPLVIRDFPTFETDRLEDRWSGGDLLLQVCSDDAVPLSYAVRRLIRDARELTAVRWVQSGFNPARGSEPTGTTPRNLLGQRDGTANAPAGSAELDDVVWAVDGPDWFRGGSHLVLRRIRMDLDTWDDLGLFAKEMATARRMEDGAPITGGGEHDRPDLKAVDGRGLPIVDTTAHVVQATARNPAERMLRRGFSYDDGPTPEGEPDAGLLFAAYQADAANAFVPVQRRLAESDALNNWITHVGSAAFVVPPGCAPGEFLAGALLT